MHYYIYVHIKEHTYLLSYVIVGKINFLKSFYIPIYFLDIMMILKMKYILGNENP